MQPTLKATLQERIRRALSVFFSTKKTHLTASSLCSLLRENVTSEEITLSDTQGTQIRELIPHHALTVLETHQSELTLSQLFQEPISEESKSSTATKDIIRSDNTPLKIEETGLSPEEQATLILAKYLKLDTTNPDVINRKLTVPSTIERDAKLKNIKAPINPKKWVLYQGKKVYTNDIFNQAKNQGVNASVIQGIARLRIKEAQKKGEITKEVLLQILLTYITERNQELTSFFKIPICTFLSEAETNLLSGTENFEEQQKNGSFNIHTMDMRSWTFQELEERKHLYIRSNLEGEIKLLCFMEKKHHTHLTQMTQNIQDTQSHHLKKLEKGHNAIITEKQFLDFLNQSLTPKDTNIIKINAEHYLAGRFVIPQLQTKPWVRRLKFNSDGLFDLSPHQAEEEKTSADYTIRKCKSNIRNTTTKSRDKAFSSLESLCDFLNDKIPIKLRQSLYAHHIPTESIITKPNQALVKGIHIQKITLEGREYFLFTIDQKQQAKAEKITTQPTQQQTDTLASPPHKKRKKDYHTDDNTKERTEPLPAPTIPATIQVSVIQTPLSSQYQEQESTHRPPSPPFFIPSPESRSEKLRKAIQEEAKAYREMQIAQQVSQIAKLFQAQQQERTALPRPSTPVREPYQYVPWQQDSHYPSFISVVDGTTAPTTITEEELTAAEALLSLSQDGNVNREEIPGELSQQPQTSGIDTVDSRTTDKIETTKKKTHKTTKKKENDNKEDDRDHL